MSHLVWQFSGINKVVGEELLDRQCSRIEKALPVCCLWSLISGGVAFWSDDITDRKRDAALTFVYVDRKLVDASGNTSFIVI